MTIQCYTYQRLLYISFTFCVCLCKVGLCDLKRKFDCVALAEYKEYKVHCESFAAVS